MSVSHKNDPKPVALELVGHDGKTEWKLSVDSESVSIETLYRLTKASDQKTDKYLFWTTELNMRDENDEPDGPDELIPIGGGDALASTLVLYVETAKVIYLVAAPGGSDGKKLEIIPARSLPREDFSDVGLMYRIKNAKPVVSAKLRH